MDGKKVEIQNHETFDSGTGNLKGSTDESSIDLNQNFGPSQNDLQAGIRTAQSAIDAYMNNNFEEAIAICKQGSENFYSAFGSAVLHYLYAILSLEEDVVQKARLELEECEQIVKKLQKPTSIGKSLTSWIWSQDYNQYTDIEAHAELMFSEIQTMLTCLNVFTNQSIVALIKGALRMHHSLSSLKLCGKILGGKTNWNSEESFQNFATGVNFGLGMSNLMNSHLPSKVLKLLHFVGIPSDFEMAQKCLAESVKCTNSIRYLIAAQNILLYNLFVDLIFGISMGDMRLAKSVLNALSDKYPKSVWCHFFKARYFALTGLPKQAIDSYTECINIQSEWKKIHNICYWDIIWCHAILGEWKTAAFYSDKLKTECNWFPSITSYMSLTFTLEDSKENGQLDNLDTLLTKGAESVIQLKKRIAGKSIPNEKLVITRCQQYLETKKSNLLTFYELFYVWNMFALMKNIPEKLKSILTKIDNDLSTMSLNDSSDLEIQAGLLLFKGVCLRNLGDFDEALLSFRKVLSLGKDLPSKCPYLAQSALELGLTFMELGDAGNAKGWLQSATNDYEGYLIEAMVHIKAHAGLNLLHKQKHFDRMNSEIGE